MSFLNKLKNNPLYIIIPLLVIIWVYIASKAYSHLSIFDIDDLNSTYDSYPLWREENGRYVFNIISRIVCLYIPSLFGIHLQNAVNTIGMYSYSVILAALFSVSAGFYFIKDKNYFIYIILWIISAVAFINYAVNASPMYSVIFSYQYGYVLATVFALGFIAVILKYVTQIENNNTDFSIGKYKKILLCVLAFCAGNSTQIATYTILITLFLISLLFFIKNKFNIQNTINLIYNKITQMPIISYLYGIIIMVACPGFWIEVSWRHVKSVQEIIPLINPFLKDLYTIVIGRYICYFIILAILILLILIKSWIKNENKKETLCHILYGIIPIIGCLGYFFTLILAGETFPSTPKTFWLMEPYYHFVYTMILTSMFIYFIGFLCQGMKNIHIRLVIILPILVFLIYNRGINIEICSNYANSLEQVRRNVYTCDKIVLTSIYSKADIKIPAFCKEKSNLYEHGNIQQYIKAIYKINIDNPVEIIGNDDAMEHFHKLGGDITEKEKDKADFSKLLDKNFVLNTDRKMNESDNNNSDI